jgi:anti-sigma factor RsiW
MNRETELGVQAWMDGELPPAEAASVATLATSDPQAAALLAELKHTRAALAGNELERAVPASREFYWSRIQRELERLENQPAAPRRPVWLSWWMRFLAPAAIVAVLALVLFTPTFAPSSAHRTVHPAEIESPLDDVSVLTFRSEAERMTVVWVNFQ